MGMGSNELVSGNTGCPTDPFFLITPAAQGDTTVSTSSHQHRRTMSSHRNCSQFYTKLSAQFTSPKHRFVISPHS